MGDKQGIGYTEQVFIRVQCLRVYLEDVKESSCSILFKIRPSSRIIEIWDTGIEIRTQLKGESIQLTQDELVSKESVAQVLLSTEAATSVMSTKEVHEFADKFVEKSSKVFLEKAENDNEKCISSEKISELVFYTSFLVVRRHCHKEKRVDPVCWFDIESLEKVVVHEKQDDTCSICLGKIKAGGRVTRMPCKHMFHDNCIVLWLTLKHRCPLCRFAMPFVPSSSSFQYLE
ncbi:hypothetical protein K2173_018113 [Erythroxylum novogranatense]|uniref:RING-type E3 ubiquitin transferase n=1 Tax=Erythroxylum novogranatense TaxID=1862640 RepID=A0AAV8U9T4_9ROSI|nr:hypothetical protein K2173_018113 [Erythroxylum novogranatense]